jgi:hypothetical protein
VKGIPILRVLQRVWIPLVIVLVLVSGYFTVERIRGIFGSEKRPSYSDSAMDDSKPFNPKVVTYKVLGPLGSVADISYFDVNAEPKREEGKQLPWTSDPLSSKSAAIMGNIVAQGNGDWIECQIIVDDNDGHGPQIKAHKRIDGVNAFTYCVLKGA